MPDLHDPTALRERVARAIARVNHGLWSAWLLEADAAIAAMPGWRPIETAPRDRLIEVFAPGAPYDLPDICCCCQWREDAGFGVDELRQPTHWREFHKPLIAPPSTPSTGEVE